MRTIIILLLSFICMPILEAQENNNTNTNILRANTDTANNGKLFSNRNVFWFTPVSRNTEIKGIALGLMATPLQEHDQLKIKGLNITIDPFVSVASFYTFFGSFFTPFIPAKYDIAGYIGNPHIFMRKSSSYATIIHGMSIGTGNYGAQMQGFSINAFNSLNNEMDGLEITTIMNMHYSFKGMIIALFRNKTTTGNGVQIGLINNCKEGRIIQIGLINKIGKRILPIFNCSLKKQKNIPAKELIKPKKPTTIKSSKHK